MDDDTARCEQIFDALDLRTAHAWNALPDNTWRVHSWSDFNRPGEPVVGPQDLIPRSEFDRRKWWCSGVGRLTSSQRAQLGIKEES